MWSSDPTCESLTLCEKYWPYLWNTNTACETLTPLTNRSHYVGNVYRWHPTGESVANLWKILPVTNWLRTGKSLTLLRGTLISFSTDYLVNHTHTHTHTHKHTMPWHRAGKAAYLTTIFNTQQCTSLQCSTSSNIPHHNTQRPLKYLTTTLNTQFMVSVSFIRGEKEVHQRIISDYPAALEGEVGFSLSTRLAAEIQQHFWDALTWFHGLQK